MESQRYMSSDDLVAAMAGWDLALRPQERGGATVYADASPGIMLNWVGFEGRVHQVGAPPGDCYTIGILTTRNYALQWNGRQVSADNMEVFAPGQEYESSGPGGFGAFTLSIERSRLDGMAEQLGLSPLSELTGNAPWIGAPEDPVALDDLRQQLWRRVARDDAGESPAAIAESVLMAAQRMPASTASTASSHSRRAAFLAALDVMQETPVGEPLTVHALCQATGVSVSTLERAFRERVGVGPKSYLIALRLHGVRRALRAATRPARVGDVANRWGFWHMGKFAADYRRLFGELPSATLAATARRGERPDPANP